MISNGQKCTGHCSAFPSVLYSELCSQHIFLKLLVILISLARLICIVTKIYVSVSENNWFAFHCVTLKCLAEVFKSGLASFHYV